MRREKLRKTRMTRKDAAAWASFRWCGMRPRGEGMEEADDAVSGYLRINSSDIIPVELLRMKYRVKIRNWWRQMIIIQY